MALPPGKYPRDSPRALATWPLVVLIIGVFTLAIALIILAVLAIMGGSSPEQVRHAFAVIADDTASPGGWTAALLSSGGLLAVIRRIGQLGGLERQAGVTNARLDNIGAMLVELTSQVRQDRDMVREIDAHRGRQIVELRSELRRALAAAPSARDEEENDPPSAKAPAAPGVDELDPRWQPPAELTDDDVASTGAIRWAKQAWEQLVAEHDPPPSAGNPAETPKR